MTDQTQPPPVYTEGVGGDGSAILCDGVMMSISEILVALNSYATEVDKMRHPDLCLRCVDAVLFQEIGEELQERAIREWEARYCNALARGLNPQEAEAAAAAYFPT